MAKQSALSSNEKKLVRRYLVWCYKTTKEELDQIDRYFTQWKVDQYMLKRLKSGLKKNKLVDDFEKYMEKKKSNALSKKFSDGKGDQLQEEYQYQQGRMEAIEKAIAHFLGAKAVKEIERMYEEEMTTRILQAREHT